MSTPVPKAQSKFDSGLDATTTVHGCIVIDAIVVVCSQTAATLVLSILPILSFYPSGIDEQPTRAGRRPRLGC
jgi:hypothetical protein